MSDPDDAGLPSYDATSSYFENWLSSLKKNKLADSFPIQKLSPSFVEECKAVETAYQAQKDAERQRDQITKKPPAEKNKEEVLAQANEAVTRTSECLNEALERFHAAAAVLLDQTEFQTLLAEDFADHDLMTWVVLHAMRQGKCGGVDWWCSSNPDLQQRLLDFLRHKDDLLKRVVRAGGARNGCYGRALEIYYDLCPMVLAQDSQYHDVLGRLALAVALELCDPILHFDSKTEKIDPIPRYLHYQEAFLKGQLDPAFEFFTTWELRHVVNSDARNEELEWGRESLKNFRPGLVYLRDPKWRYCRVVKTDIPHLKPDWYKEPRSYDQILSGGGKCGPRAWYGRFICKAFGIPTWGAKQPGHAAMSRWTPNDWTTCLGAAFKWNAWEGRCGLDFQLETQVRMLLQNDEEYRQKVSRLEWISAFYDEDQRSVRSNFIPSAASPWQALAFAQRQRILASCPPRDKEADPIPQLSQNNEIQAIIEAPLDRGTIVRTEDGTILVPASATSQPKKETRSIFFPKSFMDGRQQLLLPCASVEYTLESSVLGEEPKKQYQFTCRVCTVHRNEDPLIVKLRSSGQDEGEPVSVKMPYTLGAWEETEPVILDIADIQTMTLVLTRPRKQFAIGVKDMRLVPV